MFGVGRLTKANEIHSELGHYLAVRSKRCGENIQPTDKGGRRPHNFVTMYVETEAIMTLGTFEWVAEELYRLLLRLDQESLNRFNRGICYNNVHRTNGCLLRVLWEHLRILPILNVIAPIDLIITID